MTPTASPTKTRVTAAISVVANRRQVFQTQTSYASAEDPLVLAQRAINTVCGEATNTWAGTDEAKRLDRPGGTGSVTLDLTFTDPDGEATGPGQRSFTVDTDTTGPLRYALVQSTHTVHGYAESWRARRDHQGGGFPLGDVDARAAAY